MAIHGKQLRDASVDLTKFEGISTAPGADKLLLSAASGALQALTLDGDLSQTISGSTISLHLKDGVVAIGDLADGTIVDESEGIAGNDNDNTIPTTAAVKDYVDNNAGGMSSFIISDGSTSETINDGNTITLNGTANEVEVAVSATDTITIGLPSDVTIGNNLTIAGNLTVNGATTTVNTAELAVEDKNIELASGSTSDTTANGGGLTLKGAGDKTFSWLSATGSWTSSEDMDLAATKEYKIGTTPVLTTDGAAKVQSGVAGGANSGLKHTSGALSLDLDDLAGATVNVAADSIAIIDADDSNSKKESIVDLVAAMAGSGITATNGVLSAAAGTTPELHVVTFVPDDTTGNGAGNLINVSSSAYTLPSNASGEVKLFVNGILQELGASSQQGDYFVNASNKIEWNSSDFDLKNADDKITISYVLA